MEKPKKHFCVNYLCWVSFKKISRLDFFGFSLVHDAFKEVSLIQVYIHLVP